MNDLKQNGEYLVLARKYRPRNFGELVGQNALVQTLTNAIETNKIHHAYVLTGIRGTGKTTTARIMAMALNCTDGPKAEWPADDVAAANIAAGKHVDVLEFDAASHRKAEEIAELFEGVAYAPIEGRYKVYIIDEVHMLSKHAFNAILKTLEEPPENVKFIFATTEVNKIPVTVLSRCQRFDLKRVSSEDLVAHYENILKQENIKAETAALLSIARAADGSVRDGLSLLDQAIALAGKDGITAADVGVMLGQADVARLYDLVEAVFAGESTQALDICGNLYAHGQDAALVVADVLQLLHLLTRLKIVPGLAESGTLTELETTRGVPLVADLPLENLSRAYQILSTAASDVKAAARPFEALEMAIVRLTHLAALPPVAQLAAAAAKGVNISVAEEVPAVKKPDAGAHPDAHPNKKPLEAVVNSVPKNTSTEVNAAVPPWEEDSSDVKSGDTQNVAAVTAMPETWQDIITLIGKESVSLGQMLKQQVRPVLVAPPKLDLIIERGLHDPDTLLRDLRSALKKVVPAAWAISLVAEENQAPADAPVETLAETMDREKSETITRLTTENADIQSVLQAFPDAEVVDIA